MITQAQIYKQTILNEVERIKKTNSSVLIFGAARAGWYVIKVLEHFGIKISGILDNNQSKYGTYLEYPVGSPASMYNKYPDSILYLGLFVPNTAQVVESQMRRTGFQQISFLIEAFLFSYFIDVAGRNVDEKIFAESIKILFENYNEGKNKSGYDSKNHFISPYVTGYLTQRCSLKCKDCGSLMPYYKSPKNFDVDDIVNDIKQYAKAFDVVPEISLSGGEPFLHPEFHIICEKISTIPNIIFINFTTNGTILPSEEQLQLLAKCGADVHQSNYGNLSKKQNELFEAFSKYNIYCDINFVNNNHKWFPGPQFTKYNRKDDVNNEIFRKCIASNCFCCQIAAGELHRCAASMNGTRQGLLPINSKDYVNLQDRRKIDSQITEEIRAFLMRDNAISACDFCNLWENEFVEPAIQLQKNNYIKKI